MIPPNLLDQPVHLPGTCFFCRSHEGPVVDTQAEVPGEGRVYICTRICLPLFAGTAGYATPETRERLEERLADADLRISALENDLAWERNHKVVAVSDILKLADRAAKQKRATSAREEG